jgi:RimJ/RimL family protein N-acetyltransferase
MLEHPARTTMPVTPSHHRTLSELEAGLDAIRAAPAAVGTLELIVRRPGVGRREVLAVGTLDPERGLVGDDWLARGSRHTTDRRADPEMQINVMNVRVIALLSGDRARWPLAGDQLYVDLDLAVDRLPVGARLAIGGAELEVTAAPHLGCRKFADRFGAAAMQFVNSDVGRALRLRGLNARIVAGGEIRAGDGVRRAGLRRTPVLASERLLLTPVVPADTDALIRHWSHPDVRRYLWDGRVPQPKEVTAIVESSVHSATESGYGLFRLDRASEQAFVGVAGVRDSARGPELVYSLEPDEWHRGYANEAARRVITHCFTRLGLRSLSATVDAPNLASIGTLERLGFRREAVERRDGLPFLQVHFRLDAPLKN